jgi:apolipoprotein N-acyltransferase
MTGSQPSGNVMEKDTCATVTRLRTSWLWLPAAGLLLLFANGRNNVPLSAWLAPVLMMRFLRGGRIWRLLAAWPVAVAAWAFQFRGMVPAPQPFLAAIWLAYGLAAMIPFVVDRLMARRLGTLASTLVFPCAAMGSDYLISLVPYGSWGSPAYTQYGNLPLMQLASITGIYGITFLLAWFAAVVNAAWEKSFELSRVRSAVFAYTAVLGGVLFFGGVRLAYRPPGPTVRVASITRPDIRPFPSDDIARRAMEGRLTAEELQQVRDRSRVIDEDLLRHAAREADAGARMVFWGEGNSYVLPEDEAWLMDQASQLARDKQIYLGLGNVVWHYGKPKPLENTLVLFDPEGTLAWKFLKAHPVPGGEAAISMRGDGSLKFADTRFGRISGVICFDADSVQLLRQAGRGKADIVLIPSNDWRAIDPWHTQMAVFRAVEQGFNMVRQASGGLSVAVDYRGRVLGSMDHYQSTADRTLVVQVPIHGVGTAYSYLGDLFSWLALAGLASLCVMIFGVKGGSGPENSIQVRPANGRKGWRCS